MHPPWSMNYPEWLELGFFFLLGVITTILLLRFRQYGGPAATTEKPGVAGQYNWRTVPEIRLITLALPLELLWEVAQFPLYTVWHEGSWNYILYGLAHCTIGDLMILLVLYWVVALLNRDRRWYLNNVAPNGILFTILGAGYTVFSEIRNVRIKGTWDYTDLMPIVPIVEIGGSPFLQWLLIPPVLLWFMRISADPPVSR